MKPAELFDLTGKTALVTGGTHGIGMALATALGQAGARIVVNDIFEDKLVVARKEYAAVGLDAYTLVFDVTREEDVDRGITQIEREVGPVDILVNNAGIIKRTPILDMKVADFKEVLEIDLVAPLIVAKRVAPGMIARGGGKIINICSLMSLYGRNTVSAYASAKGGLKLLTQCMCCEWAKHNIQANGIGPGLHRDVADRPDSGGRTPVQRSRHDSDAGCPLGRAFGPRRDRAASRFASGRLRQRTGALRRRRSRGQLRLRPGREQARNTVALSGQLASRNLPSDIEASGGSFAFW